MLKLKLDRFFGDFEEREFDANEEALDSVTEFIEEILESLDVSMKVIMQINLATEEIFVNIAKYAYNGQPGKVWVSVSNKADSIVVSFKDKGNPFNPLAKADPDVTLSAEERDIGGLGIFMVKKTMDDVKYEYKDNENIFTIIKGVG